MPYNYNLSFVAIISTSTLTESGGTYLGSIYVLIELFRNYSFSIELGFKKPL